MLYAVAVCSLGKVRQNNEDNFCLNGEILPEKNGGLRETLRIRKKSPSGLYCGVFDGMGGHEKGEYASWLSACEMKRLFSGRRISHSKAISCLKQACQNANDGVCRQMIDDNVQIGSTASMIYVKDDRAYICNVGDSPVFCLRNRQLEPVYEEHTGRKLMEQIQGSKVSFKKKYPLTQYIGIFPDQMLLEPYCVERQIEEHDIFLLCSDGLTDMVDKKRVTEILNEKIPFEKRMESLLFEALQNGGKDNITAIGLKIEK